MVQHGEMSFFRTGREDAPPVVFLHGVGISSWMWTSITAKLSDLQCVLVDLPGHGASRNVPWYSLERSARDIGDLIDREFGPRDVHIVGLSLGAYVGLTLMSMRPTRVTSAVLSGLHAGGMRNRFLMKLLSAVAAPLATRPFFARRTARQFGGEHVDVQSFVTEAGKTRAGAFFCATNAVVDFEAPANLGEISTRAVLCGGGAEHALIKTSLPILAGGMPNGTAAEAPGLGHGWAGQDPTLFAETVRAQVRQTALPGQLCLIPGDHQD